MVTERGAVCQSKGCSPDEQLLQLLLVTHINQEQMAAQVAREREKTVSKSKRGSHKRDMIEIDVFGNHKISLQTHNKIFILILSRANME